MTFLKGVFWDLDGTIANTELEAHLPAFNKSFEYLGLNWVWDQPTYLDLLKINGGKNRIAHYSHIKGESLSNNRIVDIHQRKQKFYLSLINDGAVKLKPGVSRLVSELYRKKIRQFIVTSSSKVQVESIIKSLFKKINPFEFNITSDDVSLLKPNPYPYNKALSKSRLKRENVIVFEDSMPGIKSSTAANPTMAPTIE